jgi:hypothetical protein
MPCSFKVLKSLEKEYSICTLNDNSTSWPASLRFILGNLASRQAIEDSENSQPAKERIFFQTFLIHFLGTYFIKFLFSLRSLNFFSELHGQYVLPTSLSSSIINKSRFFLKEVDSRLFSTCCYQITNIYFNYK